MKKPQFKDVLASSLFGQWVSAGRDGGKAGSQRLTFCCALSLDVGVKLSSSEEMGRALLQALRVPVSLWTETTNSDGTC